MFVAVKSPIVILKAKQRKKPRWTKHNKKLEALSNKQAKVTSQVIIDGVKQLRSELPTTLEIADAWSVGGYPELIDQLDLDAAPSRMSQSAGNVLLATLILSTRNEIDNLPEHIQSRYRFDYSNPRIERLWRDRAANNIVEPILQGTRDSIQDVIHRQFTNALTPRTMAGEIKNYIGLYPRLAQAHTNYMFGLLAQGVKPDRAEALGEKYYNKLLEYRAMSIARTETNFMINHGQLQVWKQGQENGIIPRQAKKVWVNDGDPCPDCADMDGEEVGLNEVWIMADGTSCDVPTDSHPQCNCVMTIEYGEAEDSSFQPEEKDEEPSEEESD